MTKTQVTPSKLPRRAPFTPSPPLSRRLVLRGGVAAGLTHITLPVLEGMLNSSGTAFAQDNEAIPTRFGVWFWGNGVRPEHWVPSSSGRGSAWTLSSELQPLSAHKSHLSVLSGYTLKTGTHPHHAGMTGVMTGKPLHQVGVTRDTIVSTFDGPSADMIAAAHYEGQTPFRSLEVGVTHFRGTDEGTTFQHLSHNGPNNPNPSEYDPQVFFQRLFGDVEENQRTRARRSVLDAVRGQVTRLRPRLSMRDQQRLEQHLDSIRALELRLNAAPQQCVTPPFPARYPDLSGREQIQAKNEVMSELMALALACDLTRAFSVQFSTCGSGVVMHPAGATDSLHRTSHDEPMTGSPATQRVIHASTIYTMEQLAFFLDRLRATPMGAGHLLDHCAIMCTSEHADGRIHSYENFPFLIAGRGGGRLHGDVHHQATGRPSITRGVLTALRAGGVDLSEFGVDDGYTRVGVNELEHDG